MMRGLERTPKRWRGKHRQTVADVRALEAAVQKRARRQLRSLGIKRD